MVKDPDRLSFRKKRDYIVLRLLSVVLTNAEDWNWARRSIVLAQEYGFNEEDDFFKEGKVLKVDNLAEDLMEAHIEIAQKNGVIAQLKANNDAQAKEIEALKAENARLKADRNSPLPA